MIDIYIFRKKAGFFTDFFSENRACGGIIVKQVEKYFCVANLL